MYALIRFYRFKKKGGKGRGELKKERKVWKGSGDGDMVRSR